MIRQDESSKRASGLVFLDTRSQALGQSHGLAFERAVSVGATLGVMLARRGFRPSPRHVGDPSRRGHRGSVPRRSGGHLPFAGTLDRARAVLPARGRLGRDLADPRLGPSGARRADLADPQRRRVRPQARDPDPPRRPGDDATGPTRAVRRPRNAGGHGLDPSGMGPDRPVPDDEAEGTMARTQGTSARPQRLIAAAATCALAAVSAVAIGRVFEGTASTYELVATALASALLACAAGAQEPAPRVPRERGRHGGGDRVVRVPRDDLVRAPHVGDAPRLDRGRGPGGRAGADPGGAHRAVGSPPARRAHRHVGGVFSAHALAFRAGSPILALLPRWRWSPSRTRCSKRSCVRLYGLAFLVAAATVLFADSLRRVQGWGPVWNGPSRHTRLTSSAGRSARKVAAATLAVAPRSRPC